MSVSVIIPVHNRLDLLAQTLASCAAQTLPSFEVLVVDDGSEEDVAGFVRGWAAKQRPGLDIRVIRQEKSGACQARNRGVAEAKGTLLNFLDSDDVAHPDKLLMLQTSLEQDPGIDVAYCLCAFFSDRPGDASMLWNAPTDRDPLDRFLVDDAVWDTCSCLWRREALHRAGGWSDDLACWQDWEMHVRAMARGVRFHVCPRVLQYCREHSGPRVSAELHQRETRLASRVRAFRSVRDELTRAGVFTPQREEALMQLWILCAVEASVYRDLELARDICTQALRAATIPSLCKRLRRVRSSLRYWPLTRHWHRNPFRVACERAGWQTENIFPESSWGKIPVLTVVPRPEVATLAVPPEMGEPRPSPTRWDSSSATEASGPGRTT